MRNTETKRRRQTDGVSSGSMADIAFLLLIFFIVTAAIEDDKGLYTLLPPLQENQDPVLIKDRNLFTIKINASENLLVENERFESSTEQLTQEVKAFILNEEHETIGSESPQKAVISLAASRNCSHKKYIEVLDAIKAAYNEIYAQNAGVSLVEWRKRSSLEPDLYEKGRGRTPEGNIQFPMNISIADMN